MVSRAKKACLRRGARVYAETRLGIVRVSGAKGVRAYDALEKPGCAHTETQCLGHDTATFGSTRARGGHFSLSSRVGPS